MLMEKYQTLAMSCVLPNPYESQFAYDAVNTESDVQLAYIDYSTIKDDAVQCNESELKAKYDQLKNNFFLPSETRAVELYYLSKDPTEADRNNLNTNMQKIAEALRTSENTDSVVRKNKGKSYGIFVSNKAFNSYPQMKAKLDSIPVGGVAGPVIDMNMEGKPVYSVVKLLGKTAKPDSIEFRGIALVEDRNVAKGKKNATADSIINVLKNGGNFEELAKKFGQEGQTQWNTTIAYENYDGLTNEYRDFLHLLDEMAVNEIRTFAPQDGSIQIIQVSIQQIPSRQPNRG
jgi:peptidyl-prolyl cis-trans isomerase D